MLGIGVNLNSSAGDFPDELRDKATSLRLASGADVDRARFAGRLLTALEARYEEWRRDGFAPIAAAWRELAPLVGRRIHVAGAERHRRGRGARRSTTAAACASAATTAASTASSPAT